ncbi:hypothetical protein L9F63_000351 [Diploptera punctata]|uniref:Uncharacterized protein n=1 Tax=Diploptera punctata TaxID=6984 RepID=A0AAD8ETW0_DIPPU|nr:hypothetical protein L9F63_000351 [Diploptera punctata]
MLTKLLKKLHEIRDLEESWEIFSLHRQNVQLHWLWHDPQPGTHPGGTNMEPHSTESTDLLTTSHIVHKSNRLRHLPYPCLRPDTCPTVVGPLQIQAYSTVELLVHQGAHFLVIP